jgi:hypothetical protein
MAVPLPLIQKHQDKTYHHFLFSPPHSLFKKSKPPRVAVVMTGTTNWSYTVTTVTIMPTTTSVEYMAGRTKVQPPTRLCYLNIIFAIHSGPQQPFICGTMGFMAIGAGKVIVICFGTIRGYSVTPTRSIVMASTMLISSGSPVNLFKCTVFCTGNTGKGMALK